VEAVVDVPLHVTSMWVPVYTSDPLTTGSLGAGVVLRPGVRLVVRPGGRCNVAIACEAVSRIGVTASVSYASPVELGVGYGVSAALALGAAAGAAALAGRSILDAARVAHVIEVENKTGLGDVIAEYYGGGVEVRRAPGPPGVGAIDRIPYPDDAAVLAAEIGREPTAAMLERLAGRLGEVGRAHLARLLGDPTYENFAELSTRFSREVGFLTGDVEARAGRCGRYLDGYYVKKGAFVALTREDEAEAAAACLQSAGIPVRRFLLSGEGIRVVLSGRRRRERT
jgi:pantoate kinase